MLGRFGRMVWRQSRDMSVYNYEKAIVYEIWTNKGYLCVSQNKTDGKLEAFNGMALSSQNDETHKSAKNKETSVFVSTGE